MTETAAAILAHYEAQPRALTPEFIENIPWHEVAKTPLDGRFVPVLLYMRNVEKLTEIYYAQLRDSPSGKDPVIGRFMERWKTEEDVHGELLNRFLNEAGVSTEANWYQEVKKNALTRLYKLKSYLTFKFTNCFGKRFTATHMTWGAINELSTLQGYYRLWKLSGHPVLEKILKAIMHEESLHAAFYYNIARLKLSESRTAQKIAQTVIRRFWVPVGQGLMHKNFAQTVMAALFAGKDGVEHFNRHITKRICELPGLGDLTVLTDAVTRAAV